MRRLPSRPPSPSPADRQEGGGHRSEDLHCEASRITIVMDIFDLKNLKNRHHNSEIVRS